ncbi:MAG: Glutamine synthetase [uncultured Bacteroidota bacterium]|nr:MAG: Glutamine synthetase [uncultured Bacteroidetes bacterium]
MQTLRKKSLEHLAKTPNANKESTLSGIEFASNVLNHKQLQKFISQKAFEQMQQCIEKGTQMGASLADQIASAMKAWAIGKGATHYSHWFQPLTGATAEKHESFFDLDAFGNQIEKFDGDQLVQQIPNASSFPSGGIRNTFEARGYSAWDPTSPAFIFENTLCIPTIFVSYTGEALDYKTPFLKSLQKLDDAAVEICRFFDKNISKVNATLGWEQEYFLIDRSLALTRPDLMLTGRTLLGHAPSKGEELNDHYFGSIPSRVSDFLIELEKECKLVGIPIKTRHNEVAPSQYEVAPVFENANLAVDHNTLLMDLMNKVAYKHNFVVLFHEKPFDKINGSGKHINWSLNTNTGINLLSPGKTPMSNLQFLSFFINTIAAVLRYKDLIKAATVSASNDLRIGFNEAPSSELSVFIGNYLLEVLEDLENVSKGKLSPEEKTDLKLNVIGKIPEILLDNTDRNRTAPIAFTGNKFEFRTVGSKSNSSKLITVLNAVVTEQLLDFKLAVDKLIDGKKMKKDDAIFNVLRETISSIKPELSIKNSTTKDSEQVSTPKELPSYVASKAIALFEALEIFSERELTARYQVDLEAYISTVQIESRTLGDMARNHIIPTAIRYQNMLIENIRGLKEIYGTSYKEFASEQLVILEKISKYIAEINDGVTQMTNARKKANSTTDFHKKALQYAQTVKPFLTSIRYQCDKLELTVEDTLWPLAKYRELLFVR